MTRRGEKTSDAYGGEHQKLRAALEPEVQAGLWDCWRCGTKIKPGQPWDLGHDDTRTVTMGPEHRHPQPDVGCPGNRAIGWAKRRRRPRYGPRPGW